MDIASSGSLLKSVLSRVCTDDMQVTTTSRIIVVATVSSGSVDGVRGFLEDFEAAERLRESNPSGLVLLQTRTLLFLLESQPEGVISLVESFAAKVGSLFGSARVLSATEDCPAPLFGRLYTVSPASGESVGGASYGAVDLSSEDVAPACWHVVSRLLELAQKLPDPAGVGGVRDYSALEEEVAAAEAALVTAQEHLVASHGSLLPTDAIVFDLAKDDRLTTVQEYVDIYGKPMRVVTIAEEAWPPTEE